MMDDQTKCYVRLCQKPFEGKSPITDQPLCEAHLQADLLKCIRVENFVAHKIAHFRKFQGPLRLMQRRLASDIQLLDNTFMDLIESLEKHKAELTAAIEKKNATMLAFLNILTELDSYEIELNAAKDECKGREAYLITESMEKSLDALQMDSELVFMDKDSGEVKMAAFPDVNSVVRNLQSCSEISLELAQQLVENVDIRETWNLAEAAPDAPDEKKPVELNGTPTCIAVCHNTKGFTLDESGDLIRESMVTSADGDGCAAQPLPHPLLLVAVECPKPEAESLTVERRIALVSFDAQMTGSLSCSFDQPIKQIYCDNEHQLLYILCDLELIVADLSGVELPRITLPDLQSVQSDLQKLLAVTGDSDKLFLLAERTDGKPEIFGFSKKSREVQMHLPVSGIENFGDPNPRVAVTDRQLFVTAGEKLHTVCLITGMLLSSNDAKEKGKFDVDKNLLKDNEKAASLIALRVSRDQRTPHFGAAVRAEIADQAEVHFTSHRRCVVMEIDNNSLNQRVVDISHSA